MKLIGAKRKSFFGSGILIIILTLTVSLSVAQVLKSISFGTSSVGSAHYILSVVIANVITKHSGINTTVEPVGSLAILWGIGTRKIDMGMLSSPSAVDAFMGTGSFAKSGKIPIALIAQGQDSLLQIVVRANSGIKTPKDLAGKKLIARRRVMPEIEMVADVLFEVYGVDKTEVKIIETSESNEAAEALKIGTVDAAVLPGGVPSSYLIDLAQSSNVVFLPIPEDKLSQMITKLGPAFHRGVIPANTYHGQTQPVRTPAMKALIICRSDLSEETVYKITKTIFDNHEEIARGHVGGRDWNIQNALKEPLFSFHPGAIRYFKEAGVSEKK